jgi:hypothetical protein
MSASAAKESLSFTKSVVVPHYAGELAARLPETVAKARQEAALHRPPTDAVRMDQNESELQSAAEKAIASEHHIYSHILMVSSQKAHELQQRVPDLEGRIQQLLADTSLQGEAAAEMAGERAAMVNATEQRMRAEVDLRSFRAKHSITEQAVYPDSHIWHFSIILALALVETIVNAFFYENAQGLLGGFMVALGVAAFNMSGALVLGMLFRFKNLKDPEKKAAGWACLVVFALLTAYCNALFAAFRANYQLLTDPSNGTQVRHAFREAASQAGRIFVLGMEFGDLMSFILFGIGVLLSIFAFYKGYTFDDRFPGHGRKDRVVRVARRAELATQETVRQKMKDFLQKRRRELQALSREPMEVMKAAGDQAAIVQHAYSVHQTNQDAIQRDLALLLHSYRDANAAIRATETPPYFGDMPDVRSSIDEQVKDGVLQILSTANDRAKVLRDRHQDALNAKLNELQRDTATLLDKTFGDFLRSVEHDAESEINRMTVSAQRSGVGIQTADAI